MSSAYRIEAGMRDMVDQVRLGLPSVWVIAVTAMCVGSAALGDGDELCGAASLPLLSFCVADCDRNGEVRVGELIRAVQIGNDRADLETCQASDANLDGIVSIDELVSAVGAALHGCMLPGSPFDGGLRFRAHRACAECRSVRLLMATAYSSYPCLNYRLSTAVRAGESTIVVVLGCATPSAGCLTALGPAVAEVDLDLEPGTYDLQFHSQPAIDRYELSVDDLGVSVAPVSVSFTETF